MLTVGSRIAAYEVASLIGHGGMGEVYRAKDTKLGRDVALKILPASFTNDPERVARFRREAQVLASLNHPHIAQIYGLDEANGTQFLVLELVDGESLDKRIACGPIPVDEALAIAKQIAEALEAAHEKGIIHRDLKPANIALTKDGQVKVLDFGLAKAVEATSGVAVDPKNSPTITSPATMTGAGMILGTAAYMAPDQAKGRPADKRSDVWAFGCLLFEMLAARRAFHGEDVGDTLANVLKTEPDWSSLPSTVPSVVRTFLARCLRKNSTERVSGMAAFLFIVTEPAVLETSAAVPLRSDLRRRRRIAALAAAAGILGVTIGVAWWAFRPASSNPVRLQLMLPESVASMNFNFPAMAISPSGDAIVYAANDRLFRRLLADQASQPIEGTEAESPNTPVFSPDGHFLIFRSVRGARGGVLKKVPTTGGSPITLATNVGRGATWDRRGILFVQFAKGIARLSSDGGTPELLIPVPPGEDAQTPQLLPDGRTILFTVAPAGHWERAQVVVQSVGSSNRRALIDGGADARYLPTGHIVYASGANLFAVPFDPRALEIRGSPVPIVEGVRRAVRTAAGTAHYAISDTGTLVYWPGRASTEADLAMIDRHGSVTRLRLPAGQYEYPRVSPDGTLVTFQTEDREQAIVWVYELAGTRAMRRLTFAGRNRYPLWSADGRRVTYQSDIGGNLGLFWTAADGSAAPERLTTAEAGAAHVPESWSPDASTLLYSVAKGPQVWLWMLSLADRKSRPFDTVESVTPTNAVFSPDGRWVAYTSTERETRESIYIQPFPPTGAKYEIPPVSGDNPHDPLWSRDGKELFYVPRVGGFNVVPVQTQPTVTFGNPTALVRAFDIAPNTSPRTFDIVSGDQIIGLVAPDQAMPTNGDMVSPAGIAAPRRIEVVLNWFSELKARLPAKP